MSFLSACTRKVSTRLENCDIHLSMTKKWLTLSIFFALTSFVNPLIAAPQADEILEAVRRSTVSQGERDVMGQIRKGRTKTPFSISARGNTLVFQYNQDKAWRRFDVRIKDRAADLLIVDGQGRATKMPSKQYAAKIGSSDVSYEDLSLRFLYWKGGKVLDNTSDSRIKGRDCYIVEVANPTPNSGQFAWVRIWIDKENGTTWQIDGYGKDGKLKKRFGITSVQRLSDGTWFFKQMKLEVRDPNNANRTIAVNYLEMDDIPES